MSAFKDMVKEDISSVFLNDLEFADEHEVNGKTMRLIIDNNEQIEREKRLNQHMDGIYVKQLLVFLSAADFGKLPKHGALLILDGKDYRVTDAIDEMGVYSITLEANRG